MTKPAAIFGSLVDMRNVASHRCARLTVEVPDEKVAEIVAMFGWPTAVSPVPVALARMAGDKRKAPAGFAKANAERSLAQQAGALCANPIFRAFMGAGNEDECADLVRARCGVGSRSEIKAGEPAGDQWLDLLEEFHGWEAAEKSGVSHE